MHRQLLLQVPNLFLKALDLESGVHHGIYSGLVRDFHHSRSKFQRRCRFRQMSRLWPNISNHDSLAVTTKRVTQEVCQFSLTVWNMTALFARKGKDNLLEETERFVNETRLFEDEAFRSCLLGHFTASKIDQVQLGEDNFVCRFDS